MGMRCKAAVSLAWFLGLGLLAAASPSPCQEAPACGSFGTAVAFVDSPTEAARQAKLAEKLVFVLHVSGNFEDPGVT